jgi:hypothetical protein
MASFSAIEAPLVRWVLCCILSGLRPIYILISSVGRLEIVVPCGELALRCLVTLPG